MIDYNDKFQNIICKCIEIKSRSNLLQNHCALVIKKGKPVIYGVNHDRSYINKKLIYSFHAETDALHRYCKLIHKNTNLKIDIFVIRIDNQNNLKNSYPCNNCIHKFFEIGVKNIYYSNENGIIVKEKVSNLETRFYTSGDRYILRNNFHLTTRTPMIFHRLSGGRPPTNSVSACVKLDTNGVV